MIPKETVDKIINESRIDEVVSDFVALKKRGVNLLGNCPFHNEKTPSFTVSPSKGIYKCFGCGVSGNSVNFVMEHEQVSYPEALKYLAKKYNITVEEKEISEDEKLKIDKKESLFLVSQFAKDQFIKNLHQTDEGKSIGLGYFKSRDISNEMMEKFGLGYSFEERDHFTKIAINKGYKKENLLDSGLTSERNQKLYDRFFGRIIFPIHNLAGRTIGFGARILQSNKKSAKYLNSPETNIYHKSDVLYGLHLAKRSMIQQDNCFLVEGYTDVISLHQKGIENVVASSGTSLTVGQIKLVKRFTPNITVLYDGDEAGIKASFRGIDLILKEGMNVKVVTFPDGEDPDSFARSNSRVDLEEYIISNQKDFISFKTSILLKDAKNDPIKRASLIKEVVQSIAIIPDMIIRSVYTQEASKLLNIGEQNIVNELNNIRRINFEKEQKRKVNLSSIPSKIQNSERKSSPIDGKKSPLEKGIISPDLKKKKSIHENKYHEAYLLRLLLKYGHFEISMNDPSSNNQELIEGVPPPEKQHQISVAQMVIEDITHDEIEFDNHEHQLIWEAFKTKFYEGSIPTEKFFLQSSESNLVREVIEITEERHTLNDWQKKSIYVTTEQDKIKLAITVALNRLKLGKIKAQINQINEKIKSEVSSDEINPLLTHLSLLNQAKLTLAIALGRNL